MSYEYLIQCKDDDLDLVFKAIIDAAVFGAVKFELRNEKLFLKDVDLPSTWSYDVSIKKDRDGLQVVLVGWSVALYEVFKKAMQGFDFEVLDEDTEENVSLENLFRINFKSHD
jgi:hypothetical protein